MAGYSPKGRKELDMTEATNTSTFHFSSEEQVSFNFMATVTIYSDFGAPKNKVSTVSTVSPSISHEVMGPDAMILVFGC